MKYIVVGVLFLIVVLCYAVIYVFSTAKHDPDDWHGDPLLIPATKSPNSYRVAPGSMTSERVHREAPIYDEQALVLAIAFNTFALNQRDTSRIAGLPSEQVMTYVQVSKNLKAPDYISVKFIDLDDGRSTLAIYSRSRFGYGDLGVNKKRVEAWLKTLEAFEIPAN